MEKHVYFVRHGESDSNLDGVVRGEAAMLSNKGKEQALLVAERIKKIGVDTLISSPFPRTMDTAEAISRKINLPIEKSDLFVERRRPSSLHGLSWMTDSIAQKAMQEIHDGYESEIHRHSDEENFSDLQTRVTEALSLLEKHPSDRICVVTHGIFLRVIFCAVLNGTDFTGKNLLNSIRNVETDNTGVSHIVLQEEDLTVAKARRWTIKNWNDSTHLG